MNIFQLQKDEKNTTIATLNEMKQMIEQLKNLNEELSSKSGTLIRTHNSLEEKVETLDITMIGKSIEENRKKINDQVSDMEKAVKAFKTSIEENSNENISKYKKSIKYTIYAPIVGFIIAFIGISYIYFTNVRYIKNQTEELVNQNKLLKDRINRVYWILAEDEKFWYDKESKELFVENAKWLKNYKENLKKNKSRESN